MDTEGFKGILRAGRDIAAGRRSVGRDADLIKAYQSHKRENENLPYDLPRIHLLPIFWISVLTLSNMTEYDAISFEV